MPCVNERIQIAAFFQDDPHLSIYNAYFFALLFISSLIFEAFS